jgi:hypothetical protein
MNEAAAAAAAASKRCWSLMDIVGGTNTIDMLTFDFISSKAPNTNINN